MARVSADKVLDNVSPRLKEDDVSASASPQLTCLIGWGLEIA